MSNRTWITGGTIVVAAAVLTAALGGGGGGSPEPDPHPTETSTTATPSVTLDPTETPTPSNFDLTEFVDDDNGYAISYPTDWGVFDIQDQQLRLVATPNDSDSMLVRVVELQDLTVESVDDLAEAKPITDALVAGDGIEVLIAAQAIELDGLPGLFYFYRFPDEESGAKGVHSHYFVFDGARMIVIVLQALPEGGFEAQADLFDAIIASFRTL